MSANSSYDTAILLREYQGQDPNYKLYDSAILQVTANSTASSNQVVFVINNAVNSFVDLSALSTGLSWVNTTTCSVTLAAYSATAMYPANIWAPKVCGYMAYINSIGIILNGVSISANSSNLSLFNWLRYLRTASKDFHAKVGPLIGMSGMAVEEDLEAWIDSSNAISAGATNQSFCSTVRPSLDVARLICPTLTESNQSQLTYSNNTKLSNRSLLARSQLVSNNNDTIRSALNNNVVTLSSTGATNLTYTFITYCYLPLRFIHDFFAQAGVLNGFDMRLNVYFNNVASLQAVDETKTTNDRYPGSGASVVNVVGGNICPINVTEMSCGLPANVTGCPGLNADSVGVSCVVIPAFAAGVVDTFKCVFSSYNATAEAPICYLQQVVPYEQNMREFATQEKSIRYLDHQVYQLTQAPSSLQWNVVSSSQGIKRLTVLGYRNSASIATGQSGYTDCSSNTPYLSSPLFNLSNPVVLVGNQNINPIPIDNMNRDYAQNQLIYGVGASQQPEVSSGLYTKACYNRSKMYTFDVSHYTKANESASLVFRASNPAGTAIDLAAVVETEWLVNIKASEGQMSRVSPQQIGPPDILIE